MTMSLPLWGSHFTNMINLEQEYLICVNFKSYFGTDKMLWNVKSVFILYISSGQFSWCLNWELNENQGLLWAAKLLLSWNRFGTHFPSCPLLSIQLDAFWVGRWGSKSLPTIFHCFRNPLLPPFLSGNLDYPFISRHGNLTCTGVTPVSIHSQF